MSTNEVRLDDQQQTEAILNELKAMDVKDLRVMMKQFINNDETTKFINHLKMLERIENTATSNDNKIDLKSILNGQSDDIGDIDQLIILATIKNNFDAVQELLRHGVCVIYYRAIALMHVKTPYSKILSKLWLTTDGSF